MKHLDPTAGAMAIWLKQRSREELKDIGWVEISKRFTGITEAVAPFLRREFPDDKEQSAAYDGMTLALWAIVHFEDVEELSQLADPEYQATADQPEESQ